MVGEAIRERGAKLDKKENQKNTEIKGKEGAREIEGQRQANNARAGPVHGNIAYQHLSQASILFSRISALFF